jgi:hypothetical protein
MVADEPIGHFLSPLAGLVNRFRSDGPLPGKKAMAHSA